MIRVGVIGYGYWGPNIVRNFSRMKEARVTAVCDASPRRLQAVSDAYPQVRCLSSWEELVSSPEIDVVAVITPVHTHYEIAKKALQQGKHVFVEKPFTATSDQAKELIDLAAARKLVIMVDHTFLFTGAVKKIKQLIDEQQLGDIYYYDSTRVNLGLFQHDVNVIWDLAPHDFAIMNYLTGKQPESIMASGKAHVNHLEDVAYVTVYFSCNLIAHFNVNWLSPVKVRNTLIGGEKKMLVWNDVHPDEKLKVYDKGVAVENAESIYNLLISYRSGDMWTPRVDGKEALQSECEYLIDCIQSGATPFNDGQAGLKVVQLLEACDRSLKNNGAMEKIN